MIALSRNMKKNGENMISTDKRNKVIEELAILLPKLLYLNSHYGKFPTKGDGGDDCLWLGLLSSVGVVEGSHGVSLCQADRWHDRFGMFYRNPYRRSIDNGDNGDFFSRDMATVSCSGLQAAMERATSLPIGRIIGTWPKFV